MTPTEHISLMPGAEMRMRLQKKPDKGVLLLHGFLGNPAEMAWLGEQLFAAGYSVHIPRYPGHGTTLREMTRSSARQWFMCAREAWLELNRYCDTVYIAGLSMGGLFTVLLAEEFNPEKIVTISMPQRMRSVMAYASYLLWPFMSILWSQSKDGDQ
jgi:esterase/lipase